jgi:YVTN family beta-propeller protein
MFVVQAQAQVATGTELLPTGVFISPTAIPGANEQTLVPMIANWPANYAASGALKSELSPDGQTLAILTAGYNDVTLTDGKDFNVEYVFIYDVSGANKATPKLVQTLTQKNSYAGLIWNGNTTLYATGGTDDNVHVFTRSSAAPSAQFSESDPIALGHGKGIGIGVPPNANGLAVSADGKVLVVANDYNDSISVVDTASKKVIADYDLRPFNTSGQDGVAGGEFPWAVALKGNGIAFISSVRDREVVAVDLTAPATPKFVTRIKLSGNAFGMTFSPDQSRLFVAQENADQVSIIDTANYTVLNSIDTRAPAGVLVGQGPDAAGSYTGVSPIAARISPDGKTLYVVNNQANSIAVIPLEGANANKTVALLPTGYAPKDITFSTDGAQMYIINGKSNTGANGGYDFGAPNEYQFQLEKASLVSAPVPTGRVLDELTTQVAMNNRYSVQESQSDINVMKFLHDNIKHVIYIVRENRTYDQVLGDLKNGANGDKSLTMFGAGVRPNDHAVATNFVTLDNFMDPGDGSKDGWDLLMRGGITTTEELAQQLNYSNHPIPTQGQNFNNGIPVGVATTAERDALTNGAYSKQTASLPGGTSNVLPGASDVTKLDAPFGVEKSDIWEAALNAGLTVRSYGFGTWTIVGPTTDAGGKPISDPYAAHVVQMAQANKTLAENNRTDLYFRGLDTTYPDTWRFHEWMREFKQFEANGELPSLSLVRLGEDHMGDFQHALAGLDTPEKQQADNDYAVGKLIETVSHSPRYSNNTLIIVVEDDSQDGPDHVDSHRSPTFVVGPYVKQGAVISTPYTLVSAVRTIEDVLGTKHMNINTAYARPMTDVFDIQMSPSWSFNAVASTYLQGTGLQATLDQMGVKYAEGPVIKSTHDVGYWEEATRGFDFSGPDLVPNDLFNKVLWKGLMGDTPYPAVHSDYSAIPDGAAEVGDADADDADGK